MHFTWNKVFGNNDNDKDKDSVLEIDKDIIDGIYESKSSRLDKKNKLWKDNSGY